MGWEVGLDDTSSLVEQYTQRHHVYESLRVEACFALEHALQRSGIKIHTLASRVKDPQSFAEKISRKAYIDPFAQMPDLVGLRVVCLFLSDLSKLDEIVKRTFDVTLEENKIETEDVASFGYMSVHYECLLGEGYSGPRYNQILSLPFEIQVRTIVMDAWANISHHLSYKGEASIPQPLRKDFHALSGLFYLADQHFELFFREAQKAEDLAVDEIAHGITNEIEIDAATLKAFIEQRYPDRSHGSKNDVSELAEELTIVGFTTIGAIEDVLAMREGIVFAAEESLGRRYSDVGVVRLAVVRQMSKKAIIDERRKADLTAAEIRRMMDEDSAEIDEARSKAKRRDK
jgi:putative GTP pyrophosphokinase